MQHKEIIHLTIAYTIVGAFVFTVIITCLSLVGWIKFADNAQQDKLFYILIVEFVVGFVGYFFKWLNFSPENTASAIANRTLDKIDTLTKSNGERHEKNESENAQNWNSQNRAHTTTWSTLRVLDQNMMIFNDSGIVKMSNLTFWNPTASDDMRNFQATALANQMDNVFRDIRLAKFKEGMNKEKAINCIKETLLNSEKTVSDLAEINKSIYKFWGENG